MSFKHKFKGVLSVSAASAALLQSGSIASANVPAHARAVINEAIEASKSPVVTEKLILAPANQLTPGFKIAGHRSHSSHSSHSSHYSSSGSVGAVRTVPVPTYTPPVATPPPKQPTTLFTRVRQGSNTDSPVGATARVLPSSTATNNFTGFQSGPAQTNKVYEPTILPGDAKLTVEEDPTLKNQLKQADSGFAPAQYVIGIRYLTGNGLPLDKAKGRHYLELAASHAEPRAREKLEELRAADRR